MKLLVLLLAPVLAYSQGISASRQPMYFGQTRAPQVQKFNVTKSGENMVDYDKRICPNCNNPMHIDYEGRVQTSPSNYDSIRVVSCGRGTSFLLRKRTSSEIIIPYTSYDTFGILRYTPAAVRRPIYGNSSLKTNK